MAQNDYKYILESLSSIQIGVRYSYRELQDNPNVSYKFRCIIKRLLLQEVDADTTLESHLYYMKPQDPSCEVLTHLKVKVRVYVLCTGRGLRGHGTAEYRERVLTAQELTSLSPEQKSAMGMMITELQLSKMGLMSYAI